MKKRRMMNNCYISLSTWDRTLSFIKLGISFELLWKGWVQILIIRIVQLPILKMMKWDKIIEASPQQNRLFSNSIVNPVTHSHKSKHRETPSSHKKKSKKNKEQMMQNSFSAVIGQLNYEEQESKKSMVEISKTLTQIKKIQQEQLECQKKFIQLLSQQKGIKDTAKKCATNKSTANKSTIKKSKKSMDIEEEVNTKIKKLQYDIRTIKIHLNGTNRLTQKSKSMVKMPKMHS